MKIVYITRTTGGDKKTFEYVENNTTGITGVWTGEARYEFPYSVDYEDAQYKRKSLLYMNHLNQMKIDHPDAGEKYN